MHISINHFNPFLSLGPFLIEVKFYQPFRTIIHEFFLETEINWIIKYSKPRLTKSRAAVDSFHLREIGSSAPNNINSKDKTQVTVKKAVTTWLKDIEYIEDQHYPLGLMDGEVILADHIFVKDPYNYKVENPIMFDVSRRIELVTHFNVTTRYGASNYQTTHYGLSGMVVPHVDPVGYESGVKLPEKRLDLIGTGDYIATFMGWLEETEAGGGTAFISKGFEETLETTKGSAAFWTNLGSCHRKEDRSEHGGCPVLKGSKWIINKWINSWDQWKGWPCKLFSGQDLPVFAGMSV